MKQHQIFQLCHDSGNIQEKKNFWMNQHEESQGQVQACCAGGVCVWHQAGIWLLLSLVLCIFRSQTSTVWGWDTGKHHLCYSRLATAAQKKSQAGFRWTGKQEKNHGTRQACIKLSPDVPERPRWTSPVLPLREPMEVASETLGDKSWFLFLNGYKMPETTWCVQTEFPTSCPQNSGVLSKKARPGFSLINKKTGEIFHAFLSFYDLSLPVARGKITKKFKIQWG